MKNKVRKILMISHVSSVCLLHYLHRILICRFGNLFLMVSPMCLRILTVPASTVFIFMVRTIISSGCIADVTRWCGRHP